METLPNLFSAIILTAGKSQRFGSPKACIPFNNSFSFLQKLLSVYNEAGIIDFVIVTNFELEREISETTKLYSDKLNINIKINYYPESGKFNSIRIGTFATDNSRATFIQNIDNPFTTAGLLSQMMKAVKSNSYVVPCWEEQKGHPVLLSAEILHAIYNEKNEQANFRDVLESFYCNKVNTNDPRILANINTPADYMKYFKNETVN